MNTMNKGKFPFTPLFILERLPVNTGREEEAPQMEVSSHREEKITGRIQHPNRLEPTSELIALESVTRDNAHPPSVEAELRWGPLRKPRQMSHLE